MRKVSAILIHGRGDVRLGEVPLAEPSGGEVLVRLAAAPVHPADLNSIEGKYPGVPEAPYVGGREGAGFVEAVGPNVESLKPGDLVLLPTGCWRQAGVWPEKDLVRVHPSLDPEQAALLRINPGTALLLLREFLPLEPGNWVVQNAANSAVGRAVIQLARHFGWRTVNLVRDLSRIDDELRATGDVFVADDEKAQLRQDAPIRLALNAVGGESALRLANALEDGGTVVTYGAMARQPLRIPNGLLIFRDLRFRGFWVSRWSDKASRSEVAAMFAELTELAVAGIIRSKVEATLPLTSYPEALHRAAQSARPGKILLRP
jgi:mitochondrial enoyl-[acyl-carrier protein] reductase / trans-2-enoyl-CoA reductase